MRSAPVRHFAARYDDAAQPPFAEPGEMARRMRDEAPIEDGSRILIGFICCTATGAAFGYVAGLWTPAFRAWAGL